MKQTKWETGARITALRNLQIYWQFCTLDEVHSCVCIHEVKSNPRTLNYSNSKKIRKNRLWCYFHQRCGWETQCFYSAYNISWRNGDLCIKYWVCLDNIFCWSSLNMQYVYTRKVVKPVAFRSDALLCLRLLNTVAEAIGAGEFQEALLARLGSNLITVWKVSIVAAPCTMKNRNRARVVPLCTSNNNNKKNIYQADVMFIRDAGKDTVASTSPTVLTEESAISKSYTWVSILIFV